MDIKIKYFGANNIEIKTKKTSIVVDPEGKSKSLKPDIAIFTDKDRSLKVGDEFIIDSPGEYEIKGITVNGFPQKRHIDNPDDVAASIIYSLLVNEVRIAIIGNVAPELSDSDYEIIAGSDILIIPVGGHGLTLDAVAAAKIAKNVSPKIVIPTHYDDGVTKYEMPQDGSDLFVDKMGANNSAETLDILTIKADSLLQMPDNTKVVVLSTER